MEYAEQHQQLPGWHQDELTFMARSGVALASSNSIRCVKERWIHNTLRQVFLTDDGHVIKRYTHFPGRRDFRLPWKREHKALDRLNGMKVPTTRGYTHVRHGNGIHSHTLVRTLLPGDRIIWDNQQKITELAKLMANFHHHNVVTLDASQDNFILTEKDGRLGCIDFGRARVFKGFSPLALFNMGKDLYRLRVLGGLTQAQFRQFFSQYQAMMQAIRPRALTLIIGFYRLFCLKNRQKLVAPSA